MAVSRELANPAHHKLIISVYSRLEAVVHRLKPMSLLLLLIIPLSVFGGGGFYHWARETEGVLEGSSFLILIVTTPASPERRRSPVD